MNHGFAERGIRSYEEQRETPSYKNRIPIVNDLLMAGKYCLLPTLSKLYMKKICNLYAMSQINFHVALSLAGHARKRGNLRVTALSIVPERMCRRRLFRRGAHLAAKGGVLVVPVGLST